jgi:hypothetical protein
MTAGGGRDYLLIRAISAAPLIAFYVIPGTV